MSLWQLLFGGGKSNVERVADRIWLTSEARYQAIASQVQYRAAKNATASLLVAHFDESAARLEELAAADCGMPVRVVRATDLQPDLAARFDLADARLEVICPERHPLFSADEAILQFTESLNCRVRLSHHLSLEDPLLRCFSGGVLEAFMSQLGMTDTDCISHAMIGRRIRAAQRQIEQRTSSRLPAASAAEWFELNAPEFKA